MGLFVESIQLQKRKKTSIIQKNQQGDKHDNFTCKAYFNTKEK